MRRGEQLYYKRYIKVKEHRGKLFPVFFMFDGTLSHELMLFYDFEYKLDRGQDDGMTATTVAELYFYSKNVEHSDRYDTHPHLLVLDYAYSRQHDSELWGRLLTHKQVVRRIKSLTLLEQAMKATFGINVVSSVDLFEKGVRTSAFRDNNDYLLSHLKGAASKARNNEARTTSSFNVENRSGGRAQLYKSFPAERIIELINAEKDPNQKVGYLLQAGAAFRASELFHLLQNDIGFNSSGGRVIFPKPNRETLSDDLKGVILREEHFEYYDKVNPKLDYGQTDSEIKKNWFLNNISERSALPRSHLLWAGYKGIDPQNETTDVGSSIEFTHSAIETLTLEIIENEIIPQKRVRNHPFLLCDKDGYPLCKQTYERRFKRFIKKNFALQLGPHSLRHHAGCYMANNLEMPIESARMMMRHVQTSSTQVYYNLDSVTIRNNLTKNDFKNAYKDLDYNELRK
ncbi:tyrosine-type recombinase/integrase [Vibrio sp. 10N.286.48.C11]|uniref:tyrosine-type recombinase/integrase n=1 Tax=Vibrio sp. 10N.286.48.C11 TaxID=3229698 RepID=UPI0035510862